MKKIAAAKLHHIAQPYSRSFTWQDIDRGMSHARQLRANTVGHLVTVSICSLMDFVLAKKNARAQGAKQVASPKRVRPELSHT